MNPSPPDDLSRTLCAWKVEPHVPPGFQREVWRRIAVGQAAREEAFGPWWLRAWISAPLARPRHALALAAVMLLAGLGLGQARAQGLNARNWKALEARYADSVNPLAMAAR